MILPTQALSVRQPWAWAIIHAGKDIENRETGAMRRGGMFPCSIAIHTGKTMSRGEYESAREFMMGIGIECPRPGALIRGGIIGTVTVDTIVRESDSPWFFGPRGLVLSGASEVMTKPALGALGYFTWTESGQVEAPLPWMLAWPGEVVRKRKVQSKPSFPLFE